MGTSPTEKYKGIARQARLKVLSLIYSAQTSHISSNFSAIDIMTVLFEKADPKRDEVILSAGWKAAAWYYFLWKKGIITEDELSSFCQKIICPECKGSGLIGSISIFAYAWSINSSTAIGRPEGMYSCNSCKGSGKIQSKFIGLVEPQNCVKCEGIGCEECKGSGKRWGLKVGSGSMGFGLPFAVGFALAKKLKEEEGNVYCLMSDGEMQCGTTWESVLIAAHHKLDNLIVIIDYNKFQAMGKTNEILNIEPLGEKWKSFEWRVIEVDGHDHYGIEEALDNFDGVPKIIISHTTKGKGWARAENNNLYHYKNLSKEEYEEALKELTCV